MVELIPILMVTGIAGFALGGWWMRRFGMGAMRERLRQTEARMTDGETRRLTLESELRDDHARCESLAQRVAALQEQVRAEREAGEQKERLLKTARDAMSDAFKALAADALKENAQTFMGLANATFSRYRETANGDLKQRQEAISMLVHPMRETFEKFDRSVKDLEQDRIGAYQGLRQQLGMLLETQKELRGKTQDLVRALGTPRIRGRWGEMQLKRVVELAGMLAYCDFHEQSGVTGEDGPLRPDLIVRLPGGKNIVVDAKAPLSAYLEAMETDDDAVRSQKLKQHAQGIRDHIAALGRKSYWEHLQPTPEFVVLFLPGESFFSAALDVDPALIEQGVERQGVLLATPTTLIALLKAVAYGWRQERLARNAATISELGRDLYKRLATLRDHINAVGSGLTRTTEAYNRAVGSLESRVLVTARRFDELGAGDASLEEAAAPVETATRSLQAPEFSDAEDD